MRRDRVFAVLILACCALVAVWSVAAEASESRPQWQVTKGGEKKLLGAGESETLSQGISTVKNWVFQQTEGAGIKVQCTALKFSAAESSRITGPRGFESGSILFEGCKVAAPAGDTGCEVKSSGFPNGQIRSQALGFFAEEALEGSTTTPRVRWRPESTREEIVTIQLSGGSCADAGSYEVAGLLVANVDSSAQKKEHQWAFTKNTGTRLTIGGVEAEFSGTGKFTLKSGNEWGDA